MASEAKSMVYQNAASDTDLATAAAEWNAQNGSTGRNSKYVTSIIVTEAAGATQGIITITYTAATGAAVSGKTLLLSPYIRGGAGGTAAEALGTALGKGTDGAMDWACTSLGNDNATNRNMAAGKGTMPVKFAPSECK
ncbi:MAG: pilin [Burkholderiales bacterium]|nr:pilin [Burkholderiales bacterium]